ncbi:MAG: DNA-protecting protein DprA [Firmicutes bacterium]|nr:DNA-protecting protein DprA [Bacillota bacterium]
MIPNLGPKRIKALVDFFGSPKKAWEAEFDQLLEVEGFHHKLAEKIVAERKRIPLLGESKKLAALGINVITIEDHNYPTLLSSIYLPPPVLYIKGAFTPEDEQAIAVVGSRKHTFYGRDIALKLAEDLAGVGITVVSGMARGIDSWAHQGALNKRGRTIAVLGCGLDICYPAENNALMQKISENGAVVSEFPPGTRPLAQNFPRRNRIISGLSLGTVVIEALEKSGALITADYAIEQGREVFAVPGNINSPYSRGCHRLLKEGAKLTEGLEDILEEISCNIVSTSFSNLTKDTFLTTEALTGEQKEILSLIPYYPIHVDQIVRESMLTPSTVNSLLMQLELHGFIKQLPGNNYTRVDGNKK